MTFFSAQEGTVMLKRAALAALVLAGFASGAFAQTQNQTSQSPPENFGAKPSSSMGIYNNFTQITLLRQSMNNDAHQEVSRDQWRRAQQAAVMIRANHCEDAYNFALAEQDDRLALNIAVACKARLRR
ncbi:hypothetical protein [Caulobacter sp. 1776]|uniref:hypothetical protein n=1 Tax=Caulobacter sp. 1776 TaxID=3156420 RepID=UPI003394F821